MFVNIILVVKDVIHAIIVIMFYMCAKHKHTL